MCTPTYSSTRYMPDQYIAGACLCCVSRVYSGCARLRLEKRRTATAVALQLLLLKVLEVGGGPSAQQQYAYGYLGDRQYSCRLGASAASLDSSPYQARKSLEPGRKKNSRRQATTCRTAVLVDRRVSECIQQVVLERIYQVLGTKLHSTRHTGIQQ